jgi:hypothetical protein
MLMGVYSGVRRGYSQKVRTCVCGCASFGGVWHITTGMHGTARELSAHWLHRRGTRRVLTSACCRAVHRCACVCAVTPTRSPTPAPTTGVPAVAPSGMSFLEYPRVPPAYHGGAPFRTSSTALHTAAEPPLEYPRVPPGLLAPSSRSARTCLVPPVAPSGPSRRSHTRRSIAERGTRSVLAASMGCSRCLNRGQAESKVVMQMGMGLSGNGCKCESKSARAAEWIGLPSRPHPVARTHARTGTPTRCGSRSLPLVGRRR